MAVYVDPAVWPFGNMVMCHCWADSLDELLSMVDRIGVQRKWIQGHPELSFGKHRNASWVHFDISKAKRALAVRHGAIETDRYAPLEHEGWKNVRSGNPHLVSRGIKTLVMVGHCRGIDGIDF